MLSNAIKLLNNWLVKFVTPTQDYIIQIFVEKWAAGIKIRKSANFARKVCDGEEQKIDQLIFLSEILNSSTTKHCKSVFRLKNVIDSEGCCFVSFLGLELEMGINYRLSRFYWFPWCVYAICVKFQIYNYWLTFKLQFFF